MPDAALVLVVEDEPVALKNLQHVLERAGYRVLGTTQGAEALRILAETDVDVVLTDVRMEGVDGMQVLARARQLQPDAEVIVVTGYATLDAAVEAMRGGAFYYLAKPFRLDEVRKVVGEAAEKVRLKRENRQLRARLGAQDRTAIITRDPDMQSLLVTARQVAPTDCNVLITGKSGTGKELLARDVHTHSRRADAPFLAINCGAFSEELLANELFGHEKGAFTGAVTSKGGLIEAAAGGTLFLDEVSEMPASMQVKLLRVIQEREVLRLGATEPRTVDVRFVAASNRDLREAVRENRFRADLYYRLNVVNLHLPRLARRAGDIALLAQFFLEKYTTHMRRQVHDIAPEAMHLLQVYDYPGNVRELENIIARGVALATGERIEVQHLPDELRAAGARTFPETNTITSLADREEAYLRWVLEQSGGNKSKAARMLGIDRVSLWRKLKKFGMS
ncbi:MAG: sigma-54 dependent transcriptional regulator [Gammaproteobacteria bacterium]|nr:sigma-54 dependent transcriptional regulator [Gammaproteobacteria bacterium]